MDSGIIRASIGFQTIRYNNVKWLRSETSLLNNLLAFLDLSVDNVQCHSYLFFMNRQINFFESRSKNILCTSMVRELPTL